MTLLEAAKNALPLICSGTDEREALEAAIAATEQRQKECEARTGHIRVRVGELPDGEAGTVAADFCSLCGADLREVKP
jgi:hypothetical protein